MYSKFSDWVKQEIEENGFHFLKEDEFRLLVKKTTIETGFGNDGRLFTYLDAKGKILFDILESTAHTKDPSFQLPELGTVEHINKKAEYFKNYNKQKRQQLHFSLGKTEDADILEHLEKVRSSGTSVQSYIKTLIRNDIRKHNKNDL